MLDRFRAVALRSRDHVPTLLVAFLLVHVVLALLGLFVSTGGLTDVQGIYRRWMREASTGTVVGIDIPWVYPIAALLPLALAWLPGDALFVVSWLVLVTLLDLAALLVLALRGGARGRVAAWWWTGLLAAVGPVAIGRLDTVAAPIAIIGVVWLARRPAVSGAVLAFAAWIKVWPAAIVLAAIVTLRGRWRVLAGAAVLTAVVAGATLAAGAGTNLLSFLDAQNGRGLQVESVAALPWLWGGALHLGDGGIYFDTGLLTYQVAGTGTDAVASALNPVLVLVVLAVLVLAIIAVRRRGADAARLLPIVLIGLTTALVVCDKVLSPQYLTWFSPALVLIALADDRLRATSRWAVRALVVACVLTQLLYPYLYFAFLALNPGMLLLATARDALLVAVLVWAIVRLARVARRGSAQRAAP